MTRTVGPRSAGPDAVLAEAVVAFLRDSPADGAPARRRYVSRGRPHCPGRSDGLQRAVAHAVVTVGGDSALSLTLDSFASLCDLVIDMIEVGPHRSDSRR